MASQVLLSYFEQLSFCNLQLLYGRTRMLLGCLYMYFSLFLLLSQLVDHHLETSLLISYLLFKMLILFFVAIHKASILVFEV